MKLARTAVAVTLASFALGAVLSAADLSQLPWYVSRASGLVAFALLTGSMILGLLVSTKAADGVMPRALVFDLHQFMSVLVLTFTGVHAGSLLFDTYLRFSPVDLLVPFAAPYRPAWTAAGVIAGWLAGLVTASFWARKRIGQRNWRRLHYASFAAYVAALGHGIFAGTDTGRPLVAWLYLGSIAAVAALMAYRIGQARGAHGRAGTRRPTARGAAGARGRSGSLDREHGRSQQHSLQHPARSEQP